jgi:hypothetical protein
MFLSVPHDSKTRRRWLAPEADFEMPLLIRYYLTMLVSYRKPECFPVVTCICFMSTFLCARFTCNLLSRDFMLFASCSFGVLAYIRRRHLVSGFPYVARNILQYNSTMLHVAIIS